MIWLFLVLFFSRMEATEFPKTEELFPLPLPETFPAGNVFPNTLLLGALASGNHAQLDVVPTGNGLPNKVSYPSLADVMENCTTQQNDAKCGSIFENREDCKKPDYASLIKSCLVTCGLCAQYSCQNPQPDDILNCTAIQDNCNNTAWAPIMRTKCPATCGTCNIENSRLCMDKEDQGVCHEMKQFCNSVQFYDLLTKQCPSTCNRCPAGGNQTEPEGQCSDRATDCYRYTSVCHKPSYLGFMKRLCPLTCGLCTTSSCFDADSKCVYWIRNTNFCNNPAYSTEMKKQRCAKSCKLC